MSWKTHTAERLQTGSQLCSWLDRLYGPNSPATTAAHQAISILARKSGNFALAHCHMRNVSIGSIESVGNAQHAPFGHGGYATGPPGFLPSVGSMHNIPKTDLRLTLHTAKLVRSDVPSFSERHYAFSTGTTRRSTWRTSVVKASSVSPTAFVRTLRRRRSWKHSWWQIRSLALRNRTHSPCQMELCHRKGQKRRSLPWNRSWRSHAFTWANGPCSYRTRPRYFCESRQPCPGCSTSRYLP